MGTASRRARRHDSLRGAALWRSEQLLETFLRSHRGRLEIQWLPSFDQGPNRQLARAEERLKWVKGVLSALP